MKVEKSKEIILRYRNSNNSYTELGLSRIVMRLILAGFLLVLLAPVLAAWAETFNVGDLIEFQTALNTAGANDEADTINAAAGTYNVATTLTYWSSENYSLTIIGAGVGSTILDGGNSTRIIELITTSNNGHIFMEEITFQNGSGDYGGGAYVETNSADIELQNCSFNSNTAGYVGGGANIYSITGRITIRGCRFAENSSPNESGYPYGTAGGLFVATEGDGTELTVGDCMFEDNTCERDAAGAMLYPVGNGSSIEVENSTFRNNRAGEFGGGCWIRAPGGNARIEYKDNTVTHNTITKAGSGGGTYIEIASGGINLSNNSHTDNSSVWHGGGLWIEQGTGTLEIKNGTFTNNSAGQNGGGANIFLEQGTADIEHNVFNENSSDESGGGLCISTTTGTLNTFHNTLYSNSASDGGGIYFYFDESSAQASVYNNILWHDTPQGIAFSGAQTVTARYSDIENGTGEPWFGMGCIDADPLFADQADGDFHLTWANFPTEDATKSPCINAGDPASPNDPDSTVADMGAFYFNQPTGIYDDYSNIANSVGLCQNYPNPFNLTTDIRYQIADGRFPIHTTLKIFNVLGQDVRTLVDEQKRPGYYTVTWDGKDSRGLDVASGIYLYRLTAGNFTDTKGMVLLK